MQMLERYLKAIEFWLPNGQQTDILAEITEDLRSQIDDRQAELGRTLNDAELEALLKQRGRPFLVANRYRPQQSLIGPVWFPAYLTAIKVVVLAYVPIWLAVYVVVNRVQHPQENWASTLLATCSTAWTVAFLATSVVTVIFALLQFTESRTHFLENWNPRELPPVRDPKRIPWSNSAVELVVGVAFAGWWIGFASTPVLFDGPALRLTLTPVWNYFFWGYLAISLFNVGLAGVNLRLPFWSTNRAICRLASDLAGGVLFCWLMRSDLVASLYLANVSPAKTLEIENAIRQGTAWSFPIAVIVVAAVIAVDLLRILRLGRIRGVGLASGMAF